jgi:hypothetical protein
MYVDFALVHFLNTDCMLSLMSPSECGYHHQFIVSRAGRIYRRRGWSFLYSDI